jgi:hypothetical protein
MQPRAPHFDRAGGFRLNSLEWRFMTALRAELQPHPASPCPAIRRLAVEVDPAALPGSLVVLFRIAGVVGRLRLPPSGFARRADGLWQHSCFEVFLRAGPGESYHEFNLAPSGDWAAYRFGGRRSERSSPSMPAPRMARRDYPGGYELSATLPVAALPELARAPEIAAGLAAVIEADDGTLSYWALAHGAAQPDFHDPSTFLLRVAPR